MADSTTGTCAATPATWDTTFAPTDTSCAVAILLAFIIGLVLG